MKPVFFFLLLLIVSNVYSQEVEMQLSELPVKNGLIYKNQGQTGRMVTKIDGVYITADSDSCFATEDGIVSSTFNLGGDQLAVLVKLPHDNYVTYSSLREIAVKRGEMIKRGMFIGLLKEKDSKYELLYMLSNNVGKILPREKHLAYIQSNTSVQGL